MDIKYSVEQETTEKRTTEVRQVCHVDEEQIEKLLTESIEASGEYKVTKIEWSSKAYRVDDGFGGTKAGGSAFAGAKVHVVPTPF